MRCSCCRTEPLAIQRVAMAVTRPGMLQWLARTTALTRPAHAWGTTMKPKRNPLATLFERLET